MIGLRHRQRDPKVPAMAGDRELAAPEPGEVLKWIEDSMLRPDVPGPTQIEWEYARWKPGVSLTCTYAVRFEDGFQDLVILKRYADGKDKILQARPLGARHWHELSPRLVPRVTLGEKSTLLFVPEADRELPGVPQLLDRSKFANILSEEALAPGRSVRRRRLDYQLLRYKPERRAVYRTEVRLRDEAKTRFLLGCRVLPPKVAAGVIERRQAFEAAHKNPRVPRLVGTHERYGILLEQWLPVEAFAPDSFAHAFQAGEALARLHGTPLKQEFLHAAKARPTRALALDEVAALFRLDGGLPARFEPVQLTGARTPTWCHGDFHPDQLGLGVAEQATLEADKGLWILDLDLLDAGDGLTDLASWIADAVIEESEANAEQAGAELLAGYAAGGAGPVDKGQLHASVAAELQRRAAGTIRRLEVGCVKRAARALDCARELAPKKSNS